jgi:hypothetical protein
VASQSAEFRTKNCQKATAYRLAHPAKYKVWKATSDKRRRPQRTEAQRAARMLHPEKLRAASRRARGKLQRGYVLQILKEGTHLRSCDIPEAMVEAKRALLQIRRIEREHRNKGENVG